MAANVLVNIEDDDGVGRRGNEGWGWDTRAIGNEVRELRGIEGTARIVQKLRDKV